MPNSLTPPLGNNPKRFWNFVINVATDTEPESVELRISGDIVDDEDAWLYEWFGIPAASPNAFLKELDKYKGKNMPLTVWIDSYGGDVFAAAGIYCAIKEYNGKVTAKIVKAMSAASVIAMAGDEVLISPVGIMMIHNPLAGVRGYASDMRKAADVLDIIKDTIINSYTGKTGRSQKEISDMMDDETYMSANVAVKECFADGVLYQENPEKKSEVMNFAYNRLSIQNSVNESVKRLFALEEMGADPPAAQNQTTEEETTIMDLAELKEKYPDIYNAAVSEGREGQDAAVKAETERLKAFDVLNDKVDPKFLAQAKYEPGATAESVLFKAMQEGKMTNSSYVAQAEIDAKNANEVQGAASDDAKPDEVHGILNMVTSVAKKALGIAEGGNK